MSSAPWPSTTPTSTTAGIGSTVRATATGTRQPAPAHHLVWVADIYRRYDLGNTLLRALAGDFGCQVTNACQAKAGL
ncbi:hypothetical protein TPA0598_03_07190 [Streptomyces lydicamycinicus]|uniref:Uncharacterized protein n=1 Tax=Streptomyces lydicamycinicus TaxID=1546107 RepID=A0A0P4R6W7_9ACTN|nr:hypothetical protein TPA0598_03_07190 [Streptomyces lydicamycinicus]